LTGSLFVSILVPYTNIAAGFSQNFVAQIAGRTGISIWNFGDGSFATNRPVQAHSWANPGDYTITLTAFNDDNPSGVSTTTIIHVANQPIAFVNITNDGPVVPYDSWATAATNIQDAVDAAYAGGTVLVSDGVYQTGGRVVFGAMTNRLVVNKPVSVQSVNGPLVTVVQGQQVAGTTNGDAAIRCAYLGEGATFSGLTLNAGATRAAGHGDPNQEQSGGAVWCWSTNCFLNNCILSSNSAAFAGGGVRSGTLTDCVLAWNSCSFEGGGGYSGTFIHCSFSNNTAVFGAGGNAIVASNCVFAGNAASQGGAISSSSAFNSIFTNNSATFGGGTLDSTVNNSLLAGNTSSFTGGGANGGGLTNCTIVGNAASSAGGGTYGCNLYNCVVFYNSSPSGSNFNAGNLNYCCTTPLPSSGAGNMTNEPLLMDLVGNFRLQPNSPCINSGYNSGIASANDLDGHRRIVAGTVDIGAYEFQSPASILSYAWAQSYGLLTDGSADLADSDGDGMNNWQEWVADTNPTNASSSLVLLSPSNSPSGLTLTWLSASTRTYFVQRTTNLVQTSFSSLATAIAGKAGTTSFTDRTATNGGPFFYRVGVFR
jgi:hypothetical protein